jgi:thioredoxin-like negative regulator of GroEL
MSDREKCERLRRALKIISRASKECTTSPTLASAALAMCGVTAAAALEATEASPEEDERLTREEWLAQLEQAAAEAQNGEDWSVKLWFTWAGGNDAWAAQGQEKVVYGSDPIAALEALAEAAKPSRPDLDEMSAEALWAELEAVGTTKALRIAVRALREHTAQGASREEDG